MVKITPTLQQAETGHLTKETRQNEHSLSIIKQKQDIVMRRLKELDKLKPEDFNEEETERLLDMLEELEQEEARGETEFDKNQTSVMQHEYNEEESVDSFDSDYKNTNLGLIDVDPTQ